MAIQTPAPSASLDEQDESIVQIAMHIRPFSGYCICQPIPQSAFSAGGLMIPETSRDDLKSQFTVISCGKGRVIKLKAGTFLRLAPEVKVGDRIVANSYAGKECVIDNKHMRLIPHDSIMAVVEDSE